jgi:hypothetical protein
MLILNVLFYLFLSSLSVSTGDDKVDSRNCFEHTEVSPSGQTLAFCGQDVLLRDTSAPVCL